MNIVSVLNYQIKQIEILLRNDLSKGTLINHFYICEDEVAFLDIHALEEFITQTKIENLKVLESICLHSINIINIWNNDLIKLPDDKFDECFIYRDKEGIKRFSFWYNFHTIYLKEFEFNYFDFPHGKDLFLRKHFSSKKLFLLQDVIITCNNILNFLTASFPEILKPTDIATKNLEINESSTNNDLNASQRALIAVYTKKIITRKDGNNIYGFYSKWSSKQNRIGNESTERKLANKIKLFKSIVKHLPIEKRNTALNEIQTLKSKLSSL